MEQNRLIEDFKEVINDIEKGDLKGDMLVIAVGSIVLHSHTASDEEIDEVAKLTNESVTRENPLMGLITELLMTLGREKDGKEVEEN